MPLVVLPDAVGHDLVEQAGEVQRVAVREVSAVRQVHAHHGVAGLHRGQVHRQVGLCPGVRLHVRMVGAEQFLGARDRQRLGHVHELAPTVVALARVAFGILVRQHRALRFEDGAADEVLRGDEFESEFLPVAFVSNRRGELRVDRRKGTGQGRGGSGRHRIHCNCRPVRAAALVLYDGVRRAFYAWPMAPCAGRAIKHCTSEAEPSGTCSGSEAQPRWSSC